MAGLIEDMKDKIILAGLVTPPWEIFLSKMPPDPDRVIALYETAGQMPFTSSDYPLLAFQVRTRATDYPTARDKMSSILLALHNASISGYVYILATQSGPVFLGEDAQANRPEFSLNFRVMKASLV